MSPRKGPVHCPHCGVLFPDIWGLKRHQEEKPGTSCPNKPSRRKP